MRRLIIAAGVAAVLLAGTAASAQMAPAANPAAPGNPAIATRGHDTKPGSPAPGANSFTEGQARKRIEHKGYSHVSALTKNADGLWMGAARKGRKTVGVSVDYQGNVATK